MDLYTIHILGTMIFKGMSSIFLETISIKQVEYKTCLKSSFENKNSMQWLARSNQTKRHIDIQILTYLIHE